MDKYYKCDFHLHSSSCYSRDYSKKDFLETLKKSGLEVISITDHNIIDVKLIKQLQSDLKDIINIIPGIELNISLDRETIEQYDLIVRGDFFHAVMWFPYSSLDEAWLIVKDLIENKGVKVEEENLKKTSKATKDIHFDLKSVQEKFKNLDYYLVFHDGKGERNLSDYLPNSDKKTKINYDKNQAYKHNLFYYNNKYAIEGKTSKTTKISGFFDENLETILAAFFFSDAKELSEIGKKFSWINFDGNFESLILPLSDPQVRVKTSDKSQLNPQTNLDKYLEKVYLVMKKKEPNETKEFEISFSPAYNGIIGSRGSGKTLLGSILSHSDLSVYSDFFDHSMVKYKMSNKDDYQNNCPSHKYLRQNSLLQLFETGQIKEIDFLKDFYSEQEKEKNKLFKQFYSTASRLLDYEKKEFKNLQTLLQSNINDISFLDTEVNLAYMIPSIESDSFINGKEFINTLNQEILKIETKFEDAKKIINEIDVSKIVYTELADYTVAINTFKKDSQEIFNAMNVNMIKLKESISSIDLSNTELRTRLINEYCGKIKEINKETDVKSFVSLDESQNLLEQLKAITRFRTIVSESELHISESLIKLKEETKSDPIKINHDDKIVVSTTMEDLDEYDKYINDELKTSDCKSYNELLLRILFSYKDNNKLKKFFNGTKYRSITANNQYLEKFYANILSNLSKINDFNIRLYFNGKDLEKYSPGKKSEILLDIFLEEQIVKKEYTYIILDQPEDNMDTKTITVKLIKRLRELKSSIQVFVISHSASVIINGDAENIIYANDDQDEKCIVYTQGRIIDKEMKRNIVETLDGGEKNLKMRVNKYDFRMES